jgi:hypothetical protein
VPATYLVVALEPGRPATPEPTRQLRGVRRLDQTAALFEALVAVFKRVGGRWTSVQMIMPVAAAFAVAAITFLLAGRGWAEADLRAMIAPLVTFLPGAALTMAVVELSAAEMITGASRLVAGALQLRYFSAPGGSLGWLLLVLYAAWIGQFLGDQAVGGYLSGFVGAIVVTPVACIVERRPSGHPPWCRSCRRSGCWCLVRLALSG